MMRIPNHDGTHAPVRVVHVIAGLGVGGAEHFLRRLVLHSGESGNAEHIVISLSSMGEVGEMLRNSGVKVEALGMKSSLSAPSALLRLKRRLQLLKPDVVQGWMYHGDLMGGLAARWAGSARVVWGVRTSELTRDASRSTLITRWLCARLSASVPDVIVCAAEAGRRAHVAVGYDDARMRVIPNGFDSADGSATQNAYAVRANLGLGPDTPVIGVVARFHGIKAIDTFARAAGIVLRSRPDARFLMVGRGMDSSNAKLINWLGASGAESSAILLGERSDVSDCLAAMNIFVLSSFAEGFPNVVGEAMAAGVPCVVTNVGDASLLVGDTGRVVPPGDPQALAEAVVDVLAMPPAERLAMASRAKARVRDRFSMAASGVMYRDLYAELTSERGTAQ